MFLARALLECLVYDYASNNAIISIPKSLNGFFSFTHKKYATNKQLNTSPIIADPAGTDINVAKNWANQDFCNFYDEVWKSWNLCYQALTSEDKNKSIVKWRQLLGDAFPINV
jgi:hypothetical protein